MIVNKLKKYLNFQSGFFLEVGAYDGLFQSNTLFLEKDLNWKGILIEPNFKYFLQCLKNRPKSIIINCLLTSFIKFKNKKYSYGDFNAYSSMSKKWGGGAATGGPMSSVLSFKSIWDFRMLFGKIRRNFSFVPILNFPMQLILDELSINNIDFFSLDVEGQEYDVLNGIDFDKTYIKYICIEVKSFDKAKIFNFLFERNFVLIESLTDFNIKDNPTWDGVTNDYLFVKKI
jgi:FkbM family methyltransferase